MPLHVNKNFVFHAAGNGRHMFGTISATNHMEALKQLKERYTWAENISTTEVTFQDGEIKELSWWEESQD